ncbi:MAG: four-carbon acid sugar kinase family protein [Bryobacteraceae bacterium]|nr:four-carbon acid sugar kinase family protein [Bryobacteraceae bacterium]MDW8377677.1 four-carbon acid sugar kinase family protein [Bryobacterales bacterium]
MLAAALADDTTGALELGAMLAKFRARVLLRATPWPAGADVVVLDTQSRHVAPEAAQAIVFEHARRLRQANVLWIFKKTDSTLRGPVGAEFDGLLEAFPERSLVYAPAYPRLGRTVVKGILRVNGIPVAESEFAHDPLNPVTESSVVALIRSSCRHSSRVTIHDAETEFEMERIAESLWPAEEIAAGPAGFAGQWARLLPLPTSTPPPLPRVAKPFVVCGSLHPNSRAQSELARQLGVGVLESPPQRVPNPQQAAKEIAACAAKAVHSGRADILILFGGDTAREVFDALGCCELSSGGEIAPGVPVSFTESGFPVITKAGGFGKPELIREILESLRS